MPGAALKSCSEWESPRSLQGGCHPERRTSHDARAAERTRWKHKGRELKNIVVTDSDLLMLGQSLALVAFQCPPIYPPETASLPRT